MNINLGLIPQQFHRYLDIDYDFRLKCLYQSRALDVTDSGVHPIFFDGHRSSNYRSGELLSIADSIYIHAKLADKFEHFLFPRVRDPDLYTSCALMTVAMQTTPRVHKYLALYKVYESLTSKGERNQYYSALRHCLAHSATELTRPTVVRILNELFGGLELNPDRFRDKRILFTYYWLMLIDIEQKLIESLREYYKDSSEVFKGFRVLNDFIVTLKQHQR